MRVVSVTVVVRKLLLEYWIGLIAGGIDPLDARLIHRGIDIHHPILDEDRVLFTRIVQIAGERPVYACSISRIDFHRARVEKKRWRAM